MKRSVPPAGSGPDLALIHGWGFSGAVWETVAAPLAAHFRVHRVDLPGYGGSAPIAAGGLEAIADALLAVLPEPVTLCGWSLGAAVALTAAARRPQCVDRLILVGASPSFVRRADWHDGVDAAVLAGFAADLRRDPAALLARFAALLGQGDAQARRIARTLLALAAEPPAADVLANGLDLLRDFDLRPLLPTIAQPTLLIHGGRDPLMPLAAAQRTAAALPDARLEVFADAAHVPFLSQPERFVAALAAFAATPC